MAASMDVITALETDLIVTLQECSCLAFLA